MIELFYLSINYLRKDDGWRAERELHPTINERKQIKQGYYSKKRTNDELELIRNDVYPDSTFIKRKLYWLVNLWKPVKLKGTYHPYPDGRYDPPWSTRHNIAGLLFYGGLLPFLLIGSYILFKNKIKIFIFLCYPIILQTTLHVIKFSIERYRIPIDAFVMIIGIYGLYYVYSKYFNIPPKYN